MEKSFTFKPVQCNGTALLGMGILVLANSNCTVQAYQLPEVMPAGIFYAGEPVLAIDACNRNEIVAGLAPARCLRMEYTIPRIIRKDQLI